MRDLMSVPVRFCPWMPGPPYMLDGVLYARDQVHLEEQLAWELRALDFEGMHVNGWPDRSNDERWRRWRYPDLWFFLPATPEGWHRHILDDDFDFKRDVLGPWVAPSKSHPGE